MTRIIAGTHRGRRLAVPAGLDVRPTTDRMRERVFSMLAHHRYPAIAGARVADIFAGTGALGLEALSRGAAAITFVEKSTPTLKILRENIQTLKAQDSCTVIQHDACNLPAAPIAYDLIFMDPPYRQGFVEPVLTRILEQNWLAGDGVIVCELAIDDTSAMPAGIAIVDDRSQGKQRILFLQKQK